MGTEVGIGSSWDIYKVAHLPPPVIPSRKRAATGQTRPMQRDGASKQDRARQCRGVATAGRRGCRYTGRRGIVGSCRGTPGFFDQSTQRLWMHQDTVKHVVLRRTDDAAFVLTQIAAAILRPLMAGVEFRDRTRARLVHRVEQHDCYVHLAIKLVAAVEARSGRDELWVSTAYRMGPRSLTRLRNKRTFMAGGRLVGGARPRAEIRVPPGVSVKGSRHRYRSSASGR
jgi:hypothetical protein